MTRKLNSKETEARVWIERYEQVMMDLHAAQFRLTQLARGMLLHRLVCTPAKRLTHAHVHPCALLSP